MHPSIPMVSSTFQVENRRSYATKERPEVIRVYVHPKNAEEPENMGNRNSRLSEPLFPSQSNPTRSPSPPSLCIDEPADTGTGETCDTQRSLTASNDETSVSCREAPPASIVSPADRVTSNKSVEKSETLQQPSVTSRPPSPPCGARRRSSRSHPSLDRMGGAHAYDRAENAKDGLVKLDARAAPQAGVIRCAGRAKRVAATGFREADPEQEARRSRSRQRLTRRGRDPG